MTEITKKELVNEITLNVLTQLEKILKPGVRIFRMPDGSIVSNGNAFHALKAFPHAGGLEKTIRKIIVDSCFRVEKLSPGSTYFFVRLMQSLEKLEENDLNDAIASILQSRQNINIATEESLISNIRCRFPDIADILIEAIRLAGSESSIYIEGSPLGQTIIEKITGHTFRCNPDPIFFKNGKWTAVDAKCLIIDGIVENVSEIDTLLQLSHESKRPMIIFARGFSHDVLSTLRTNFLRKTLNVIPAIVEFDLETVNVLLDIATTVGCDVISSLKGELISTVKYDDIAIVKAIICSNKVVNITCDKSPSITAHAKNLLEKRQNETIPAIKEILDARLKSLTASSVVIRLNNSGPSGAQTMHEFDEALRLIKDILANGLVVINDDKLSMKFHEMPASCVLSVVEVAKSLIVMLRSIKLAVVDTVTLSV